MQNITMNEMDAINQAINNGLDYIENICGVTLPYVAGTVVIGSLLFGAYKTYSYFTSIVTQKTIQPTVTIPEQTIAQPTVTFERNPEEKSSPVAQLKKIGSSVLQDDEPSSTGRKNLQDAISTFEKGGFVNYLKSQFGFAKAALYSAARTVANLFLATLSILGVVTAKGRAYFKSCAYGTVTNLGSALIGSLGTVSPHLGTRAYNAAFQSKIVLA